MTRVHAEQITYKLIFFGPAIAYGLNFWYGPAKSASTVTLLSGDFDRALGTCFDSFRSNSGKLTFELSKTFSYATNQAVFG